VKRGAPLKRTPPGPGKKALERGTSFENPRSELRQVSEKRQAKNVREGKPANKPSLKDGNGFGASPAQRAKVADMPCIVTGAEGIEGAIVDPAHLWPRSMGGCSDPLCVVPLRRDIHDLFEDGKFDLYPYLTPARHSDAWKAELIHALEHADMSMTRLLHELTGERHLPESEILRLSRLESEYPAAGEVRS
jgi:hypothetical protein